jgi:hypothetical protein
MTTRDSPSFAQVDVSHIIMKLQGGAKVAAQLSVLFKEMAETEYSLSKKLQVHSGTNFEESETSGSSVWQLLKSLREYSVCDAMNYENTSGSLLKVSENGEKWKLLLDEWDRYVSPQLSQSASAVEIGEKRLVEAAQRVTHAEKELQHVKRAGVDGPALQPFHDQLNVAKKEFEEARQNMRFVVFKREEIMETTWSSAQRMEMQRTPELCASIAQFVQAQEVGLKARMQALDNLKVSLQVVDDGQDMQMFIGKYKEPELHVNETRALQLLRWTLTNGSEERRAAMGGVPAPDEQLASLEGMIKPHVQGFFVQSEGPAPDPNCSSLRPLISNKQGMRALLAVLTDQRRRQPQVPTCEGFSGLCTAVTALLDQCSENKDLTKDCKELQAILSLSQTFFYQPEESQPREQLFKRVRSHKLFQNAVLWGQLLLHGITEELNRFPLFQVGKCGRIMLPKPFARCPLRLERESV